MDGQTVVRSFNANGLDGHMGELAQNEPDAGHGIVYLAIGAAGAFGEDDDAPTVLDCAQHLDDTGGVRAGLVHRNGIAVRQSLLETGGIKEGFAGQEVYLVAVKGTYKGRIQEALVVGHDDAGAFLDEFFLTYDFVVEEGFEEAVGCAADDEIEQGAVHIEF